MNLLFIWQLKHAGLALSIGLGACMNAGLLYYHLRRHEIYQPQPGWQPFLVKLTTAVGVMALVLWICGGEPDAWLHYKPLEKLWRLAWLVTIGIASYFGILWLLGLRLQEFMRRTAT